MLWEGIKPGLILQMHRGFTMKTLRRIAFVLSVAMLMPACATEETASSNWGEAQGPPAWVRYGTVTNVREVIQRREGDPAGGALAGAIIGSILGGGRGPGALFGAMGGAAVGAAASSESYEQRSYEVWVRFQDGAYQAFRYASYPPFRPGDPVALTPRGLYHA
jgi:outer membrane lipoprotein SlyB